MFMLIFLGGAIGLILGLAWIAYHIYRNIREWLNPELKNDFYWNL